MAIEIQPHPPRRASTSLWRMPITPSRISARDRMLFTERLSLLLETGTPLHGSLATLARQTTNPRFQEVLDQVQRDVTGGMPFAQALARHPAVFSSTYVNLVSASESGGFLPQVLTQIMAMDERRAALRATLVGALSYPAFLILFSLAVVVFVLTVVFPKFGPLFKSIADQLPFTTLALMAVSDLLRQHWLAILMTLALLAVGLTRWLASTQGQSAIDGLKLRIPVLRDVFIQIYFAQFMQVMSLSLGNGVSVIDTLRACRDVIRNSRFHALLTRLEQDVTEGRNLKDGFADFDFVPDLARQLIVTGDETGNLHLVTRRIAEYYERELTRKLALIARIIEPLLLLVMGLVVGLIVSALILPIFKLSRAVH